MIKITKLFYDDHTVGRDLPAPKILRETKAHYFIDESSPEMDELLNDAKHHVEILEMGGWQDNYVKGIARSARALLKIVAAK